MAKLLDEVTADGNGAAVDWRKFDKPKPDTVYCWGTFGGATVTLQASPDGTNWLDVTDDYDDPITFTAAGIVAVQMSAHAFRGVVSGAGGSTSVSMAIL